MHIHQHKRALKPADITEAYQADNQELDEAFDRNSFALFY
jgi:hypothetical protein